MPSNEARQVPASRSQLCRAVREVWGSVSYDDQVKMAIFSACLNHGLARGADTPLKLNPVSITTVEGELSRAGLLRGKTLLSLLAKYTDFFRVVDKAHCGQAVLPWLHDILPYPHPDVAALLATMPTLRQPAPPPGIPAGIPPMRKANAPPAQVPCKHFAQGNCSKGDKCDFAHEPKQQGRNASKSRSAPRETPPVDEARKLLLEALNTAWPGDDFIEIFAKTAARICIQQAFVLGKSTPYLQQVVHAPNMGTHLHKCGVGMVRGTLQQMLARTEVRPYFKMVTVGKNQPPAILCLLANAFCGHPSNVINDIVEQTYLEEPNLPAPYMLPPSIPPRKSFAKPGADTHTDSDSASEASGTSHTAALPEVAASPPRPMPSIAPHQPEEDTEPLPAVHEARMKLVMAVAQGPACEGQGGASVVRRAINYACLAKGFSAATPEDITPQHGPYLYKLQSVPVSQVGEHARGIMDNFGYGGVQLNAMLASEDYSSYFVTGMSGSVAYVRPVFERLAPSPGSLVERILLKTKTVNTPITPARTSAKVNARLADAVPAAAIQSEARQDSNVEAMSQASGDASSVVSKTDESARASSVFADHEPETSGPRGSAAALDPPQSRSRVQVKMVSSVADANAALMHIGTCDWIAVGCEGDLSKKGRICLIQVYAAPICFIFDMVTNERSVKAALISGLKQVLEDESVIKVMHDCRKPAAAIRYQLQIGLRSVFDTQVAHGYLQHVAFVTGGEVDDYGAFVELEDLLEIYDLSLPANRDMMQPSMKHWVKRPLYPQLVEYAVSGVDPLWDLGQRMMKSVGEAGTAGTIRMSKTAVQYYYDLADQEPSPEEKRNIAALAIGQYWLPQIDLEVITEAYTKSNAEDPDDSGHVLGDAASIDSMASAGAQDLEDRSAVIHDDMPLLKAHGTKHVAPAGSSALLQDSNKQEFVKPDRLVSGQSLAPQSRMSSKAEALGAPPVSSGKNANPSNK